MQTYYILLPNAMVPNTDRDVPPVLHISFRDFSALSRPDASNQLPG